MANPPNVPKFGNWESQENVPYTVFFDNARKKRPQKTKKVNPNDPQENSQGSSSRPKPQQVIGNINNRGKQDNFKIREEPGFRRIPVVRAPGENHKRAGGETRNQGYGSEHVVNPMETKKQAVSNVRTEQKGTAAIPKFGVWGENSSAAADGFTHIFEQVREDKHQRGGTVTTTPNTASRPTPVNHESSTSNNTNSCCFPWSRKE